MKNTGIDADRRRFLELTSITAVTIATSAVLPAWAATSASTRIGVIGSGKVGGAIGRSWIRSGHEVLFSSRNIDHDKALAAELGAKAHAGTAAEAAAFGEVILIAVPYGALPELGKSLGNALKGKVVIDACNPFPQRDGEIATRARAQGAGRVSAELLPGARIVRAFNAIGAARMGSAYETPGKIGMPIAGDDAQAIELAARLIRDVGYEPVLVGNQEMGKYLLPGTPLAGEHTPAEVREIAAKLKTP
ncbi:NADPH-dependent F420 reductase [Steroidobacter sp.]|uniref:NADPH-dependent F420 reductase n=1 Tax=Steroidobacter sp. TaxID=1978227 RepID=UPI001A5616E6|nr:NAD(P)-binding domain-containing protein [Steroidobacter sp.]MBL8269731.1 NAD(P)-binding domain-containing protein [Steroidobacter sp.]